MARATFDNWVAARQATGRPEQDAELQSRTRALDTLKAAETSANRTVETQNQAMLDASQAETRAATALEPFSRAAETRLDDALQAAELRVFLYRLAVTLPLLVIAGWLFVKARKGRWT